MKKSLMPYNARSALARIRFRYAIDVDPYFGILDECVISGSQGFRAFWRPDSPLQELPPKRGNAEFEWIIEKTFMNRPQ
jgi:hypothetical protein